MKKVILISVIVIITGFVFAQETCRVLLPAISGTYAGDCKQGLANGYGEATGEDFYRGDFVKGLPQGSGNYLWKNGGTYTGEWDKGLRDGSGVYIFKREGNDSILAGIWREDKFVGEKIIPPYEIEYRNSIGRVTCMKVGDRPYVKYTFMRNGGESYIVSNVLMQGSSGTESNNSAFTGYEQVEFPFKGKITFNAPNAFNASTLTCELRLTINKPGAWIVSISF